MITVFPFGEVENKLIYLIFRADINSSCGLVEQEHRGVGQKPPCKNDLLLIAARKRAYLRLLAGSLYFQEFMYLSVVTFIFFLLTNGPVIYFFRLATVAFSLMLRMPKIPLLAVLPSEAQIRF